MLYNSRDTTVIIIHRVLSFISFNSPRLPEDLLRGAQPRAPGLGGQPGDAHRGGTALAGASNALRRWPTTSKTLGLGCGTSEHIYIYIMERNLDR